MNLRYGTGLSSRLISVGDSSAMLTPCFVVLDCQAPDTEQPLLVLGGPRDAGPNKVRTMAWCDTSEDAGRIAAALNFASGGGAEQLHRSLARLESLGDQLRSHLADVRRVVPLHGDDVCAHGRKKQPKESPYACWECYPRSWGDDDEDDA